MTGNEHIDHLVTQILESDAPEPSYMELTADEQGLLIDRLIESSAGRRWLRGSVLLTERLAIRLLYYDEDFRRQRRDSTLDQVIDAAPLDRLIEHAAPLASGAGAPALWRRLRHQPDQIVEITRRIAGAGDPDAAEATAIHLLLDRSDEYRLGEGRRAEIASAFLAAGSDEARGIAAEFLAQTASHTLADQLDSLARDPSARVRGYAWLAAYRVDRDAAIGQAIELLGDETAPVEIRKSALTVTGEVLPTDMLVELLAYFVVHPNEELALEAASLLHRYHRHPEIAIPASGSPHPEVREIANRLMDPYRGSPAAGGSRPGDPLREDPLLKLMRQIEEAENETES